MKWFSVLFLVSCTCLTLAGGYTGLPACCPAFEPVDHSQAYSFASDDVLKFQFPLDDADTEPFFTNFAAYGSSITKYHAAEDYLGPAGTPVYAFAEGTITYSGPMGGYGWLIVIDHVDVNLYSLYGHLSPSRWRQESGAVEKGELVAYLGDSYENGGSVDSPLTPHLHFGVRVGQRGDYSSMGDWRWMAGWVKSDPRDMGWLEPSKVIAEQGVPGDEFVKPPDWLFKVWGPEVLVTSLFICFGVMSYFVSIMKNIPIFSVVSGVFYGLLTWVSFTKGLKFSYGFLIICLVLLAAGICRLIPRAAQLRSRKK